MRKVQRMSRNAWGVLCGIIFLTAQNISADTVADSGNRPSPFAIGITEEAQFPDSQMDIMGFRLCLIYGRHANVSGLDIGVFGCSVDGSLFGLQTSAVLNYIGSSSGSLQIAGIANNCLEDFYGFQIAGIANNASGDCIGAQIGTFDMTKGMYGAQIGVFNKAENAIGLQIGVVNWSKRMQGVQLGLINVIEDSKCPYMLILNAYF